MTKLELLSPAKDLATAITAIDCGADAVYIGAPHHGARQQAANSVEDIARLCEYAHRFRAKVYVTLNTIVYDDELDEVRRLIIELDEIGVDALIVQDMALLEMQLPPIALHASTQCDIRTPEKARFLQDVGFEQLVLPREMTLEEIKAVRDVTRVPLEVFVHGALCVSYSGDCRASFLRGGRSANRGECAQVCRLPFDLLDASGNVITARKHLLSLKDLNRLQHLEDLVNAGASSFKIEGRLKSREYVANVTAAYSQALDSLVSKYPEKYCRASIGRTKTNFKPDLTRTFHRGYTNYFISNSDNAAVNKLATFLTPKHVGKRVGIIASASPKRLVVNANSPIVNGDGLGYFDKNGVFCGLRANKVENNVIFPSSPLSSLPEPGAILYRNHDKAFIDTLSSNPVSVRIIDASMTLDSIPGLLILTVTDERGCSVTATRDLEDMAAARTPQKDKRRDILERLGNTIYRLVNLTDNLADDAFIPASILTDLRNKAIPLLDRAAEATYVRSRRDLTKPIPDVAFPKTQLDLHDNVANRLSKKFYERHGAKTIQEAIEVQRPNPALSQSPVTAMTSRYCIRREMGCCLKTPKGKKLPEPLFLRDTERGNLYQLQFDCRNCGMNVLALPKKADT